MKMDMNIDINQLEDFNNPLNSAGIDLDAIMDRFKR